MRNEVKKSLDTVFEHEKLLGKRQQKSKNIRRSLLPTIVAIMAIGLAVGLFFLQSNGGKLLNFTSSNGQHDRTETHTSQDIATIFHLKNEYIGNNVVMGEIADHVLGDFERSGIALQTNEEPYGLIISANENIPQHIQLKLAFYVFSLIPNAGYTEFQYGGSVDTMTRQYLEETYTLNLSAIDTEEDLLAKYYDIVTTYENLPQIQTKREDSFKYLFNALKDGTIMQDMQTNDLPDMTFVYEQERYSLWNKQTEIWIMKHTEPYNFHFVTGERLEELNNFLTNDVVVIDGVIVEIQGDELLIAENNKETGSVNSEPIWIGVDTGDLYQIGEKVKVWSNFVNESYPDQAQAVATKIQKQ